MEPALGARCLMPESMDCSQGPVRRKQWPETHDAGLAHEWPLVVKAWVCRVLWG